MMRRHCAINPAYQIDAMAGMPCVRIWLLIAALAFSTPPRAEEWRVDSAKEWGHDQARAQGLTFDNGFATPQGKTAAYRSAVRRFSDKVEAASITFKQSAVWDNWIPVDSVGPENLGDAPVMLTLGPNNYWMFGRYVAGREHEDFQGEDATLDGFDDPLKTTPFKNQYDAPGGLKQKLGGYHAWQSRDMVNWVHHGPVTDKRARWVTTAEYVDGKAYIYYDFPNDQNPHLFIDADLTDGEPGRDLGMVFKDPSHGSDCAIIRDLDGHFHLIYEDWSPINAQKHAWDSPLAGHAVSPNGKGDFKILSPAVDHRTSPTGQTAAFEHPHWAKEDPESYASGIAEYEVHEPEQNAYGDWAAICIGGEYYLFGDFHPAGKRINEMSVARFTSSDINEEFDYCGHMGHGHPDPDIGFAEGRFYLVTQTEQDFVSPGPWVEKVEVRVGVDTGNNGQIDRWTAWREVKETYHHISGFAKQIARTPAAVDLSDLPAGYGFCFEFRITDTTENNSLPIIDSVTMSWRSK